MLLAVNGHGSFTKQGGARHRHQATEFMRDVGAEPAPAVPAPAHLEKGGKDGQFKGKDAGKNTTAKDGNKTAGDGGALMSVTTEQLIPVYYGIVPIVTIACIIFEMIHRRWQEST